MNTGFKCKPSLGSIEGFAAQFEQPEETDYVLGYDWPTGGKISQLRITSSIGLGTVSVTINGVAVTGIDHMPVNAGVRSQHTASGANDFNQGDDIAIRFDAVSNLLNVRATIVVATPHVGLAVTRLDLSFQTRQLAISGALIGQTEIPVVFDPPLRRIPLRIDPPIFFKGATNDPNVFAVSVSDISLTGWTYHLSGDAVAGQILQYSYVQ